MDSRNQTKNPGTRIEIEGPIIIGAGPSGLAVSACLSKNNIPSLTIERSECIASLWQNRTYDRLKLHLPKKFCELPFVPFPVNFPKYPSKQQFVSYMEQYADRFAIRPLFGKAVVEARHVKLPKCPSDNAELRKGPLKSPACSCQELQECPSGHMKLPECPSDEAELRICPYVKLPEFPYTQLQKFPECPLVDVKVKLPECPLVDVELPKCPLKLLESPSGHAELPECPYANFPECSSGNVKLPECSYVKLQECPSGDVKLQACPSADVKLLESPSGHVELTECTYVNFPERSSGNVKLPECSYVKLRECPSGDVKLRECTSGEVKIHGCPSEDGKLRERPLENVKLRESPSEGYWVVRTEDGREYASRWLVVATGENAEAVVPEIVGLEAFGGEVLHTSGYKSGSVLENKRVLVIGCGNSGMEVSLDLCRHNASPSMVVRNSVHILPREMFGFSTFGVAMALLKWLPLRLVDKFLLLVANCILGNTDKLGLRRPKTGPLELKNATGKTPVLDVGALSQIKAGNIKVVEGVREITKKGAKFMDGKEKEFDSIILATGYKSNVPCWLKGCDFFNEQGMPKTPFPNSWKGENGLYTVGFTRRGILGTVSDSFKIAHDIKQQWSRRTTCISDITL